MVTGEVSTRPRDSGSLTGPSYMETDVLVLLSPSSCTGFVGAREAGMLTGKRKQRRDIDFAIEELKLPYVYFSKVLSPQIIP